MNYYVIFLGVLVLLLLYVLYINYVSTPSKLTALVDLKTQNTSIPYTNLANRDSTRYSYSVWIYVNSWSSDNVKKILSRGNDFSLSLDKNTPTLRCNIASSVPSSSNSDIIITNNFPIQKWSYVIISVDNQIIDLYLDGKLVLSTKLNNIPLVSTSNIKLGDDNPSDIFLANLVRLPTPMDPQTAWSNYLSGNGMNSSSNLNIKLSVLQDNIQQKEFTLF